MPSWQQSSMEKDLKKNHIICLKLCYQLGYSFVSLINVPVLYKKFQNILINPRLGICITLAFGKILIDFMVILLYNLWIASMPTWSKLGIGNFATNVPPMSRQKRKGVHCYWSLFVVYSIIYTCVKQVNFPFLVKYK